MSAPIPEVKPCPFCGTNPKQFRNRAGGLVICCNSLDCERLSVDGEGETEAEDAELIEAWNRRAPYAALQAQVQTLRDIKSRLDHRLNEHLCEMKSECDDSITGFNEAWDIMRGLFHDVDAALAATEPKETK